MLKVDFELQRTQKTQNQFQSGAKGETRKRNGY